MVIRTRLRTALTALGLYVLAALLTAYFGMHAYTGDRGLQAKEDIEREKAALSQELARLREERTAWSRRVALLRPESLDPDMLDERARAVLYYVHERDLVLVNPPTAQPSPGNNAAPAAVAAAR
jgi:cell division protein FtsB